MTAGCRHLQDLPASWRTNQDRRDLIRDARGEFVRASAIAGNMGDTQRQAAAEVAIAGCWLWVPSMQDFTNTLDKARLMVETELLFRPIGAFSVLSSAYNDIVTACKAYRVPAALNAGSLIVPGNDSSPIPGALFKTPCDREEEKPAGGIECVVVSGVRTAIVGVEHLPVLKVGYESLDRCTKRRDLGVVFLVGQG